ncbi:hypothetical protein TNCV_1880161 [Trichonephila clavipes]|nr:hypothetical protein TNCV_1880161 [Trichonephila clavipes]
MISKVSKYPKYPSIQSILTIRINLPIDNSMDDRIGEVINFNTLIPFKMQCIQPPSPSYHHQSFSLRRPTKYPRNQRNDQQFCDRMLQLSSPVKELKKIIQYSNLIEHEHL